MFESKTDPVKSLSLELTEACNYRCKMCDYWKIKDPKFLSIGHVQTILEFLHDQPLNSITVTGGEPLLHPEWRKITDMLPDRSRKFLCTNGSPVMSKNDDIGARFDVITVSADGADDDTFEDIRGYRHFSRILNALERIKGKHPAAQLELKMTIQKANFRQTNDFFRLAKNSGFIDAVCFGIPDLSQLAFGFDIVSGSRSDYLERTMLTAKETDEFSGIVDTFHGEFEEDIKRGFHLEGDLNRILSRFKSYAGVGAPPEPRNCRVANNNVVLRAGGMLKGCYFLGNYQHIDELSGTGAFPSRSKFLKIHSPLTNKICRSCDQIDILRPPPAFAAP